MTTIPLHPERVAGRFEPAEYDDGELAELNVEFERLPASKVIAYGYLTPAFVILFEALAGHGWPNLSIVAGAAVTVLGLIVLAAVRD